MQRLGAPTLNRGGQPCSATRVPPTSRMVVAAVSSRRSVSRRATTSRHSKQAVISQEDDTKLKEMINRFKAFDTDGNGKIDREELRALLESVESGGAVLFAQHWLPEEELDRAMEVYDTNKDGAIDFDEYTSIVYDGLLLDGMLSDYEEVFNAVDRSGNGTIGASELMEFFSRVGGGKAEMSYEKLVECFQKYDRDESGQIDFPEFLMMFRDKLLDLKEVRQYLASNKQGGGGPGEGKGTLLLDESALEGHHMNVIFSEEELDEALGRTDGKAVVIFSALTWCRPCKAMQRPVEKLMDHYKDSATFVQLFGNANGQTKRLFKERLQIRSTPCFMIYKDGNLVATTTGNSKEKVETALREILPSSKVPAERLYPLPTQ